MLPPLLLLLGHLGGGLREGERKDGRVWMQKNIKDSMRLRYILCRWIDRRQGGRGVMLTSDSDEGEVILTRGGGGRLQ